jgi:hypothetical protein
MRPEPSSCRPALGLLVTLWATSVSAETWHVFLVGDAGTRGNVPVFDVLRNEASKDAAHSLVVILGDNVYPRGMPLPNASGRPKAERLLQIQVDAVGRSGARGIMIPGNHDWDRHGPYGWDAIRREARYVEERGGGRVEFLPKDGCPGPAVVDVSDSLRIIALDTQWWLHEGPKPQGPSSGCAAGTEDEVVAGLRDAVTETGGRQVVIAAHHPLLTGGGHGGHFSWKDHLFPLRAWKGWLWLPLPIIGSAYPLSRQAGAFSQDLTSRPYRRMRDALVGALAGRPALLWAAGHDHGLQVLEGAGAVRYDVVSGAGAVGHTHAPKRLGETLYRSGAAGFVQVDLGGDESQLSVVTVDSRGRAARPFSTSLK